jgi:hypothetical protein
MNASISIVSYKELPQGSLFRVENEKGQTVDELHSIRVGADGKLTSPLVRNNGIFVKLCNAVAVNVATKKEVIFDLLTPCRQVKPGARTNMANLPAWKIINMGNPVQ